MTIPPRINSSLMREASEAHNLDVQNANALRASFAETVAANAAAMSIQTQKQYRPYQVKFEDWCTQKCFADGRLVREDKLLLFLKEVIVYTTTDPEKGDDAGETPAQSSTEANNALLSHLSDRKTKVTAQTTSCIISAIVKLWEKQVANGTNSNPHPRGTTVKGFLQQLTTQDAKRKRDKFIDKQAETIDSKYNANNFQAVNLHCL